MFDIVRVTLHHCIPIVILLIVGWWYTVHRLKIAGGKAGNKSSARTYGLEAQIFFQSIHAFEIPPDPSQANIQKIIHFGPISRSLGVIRNGLEDCSPVSLLYMRLMY